VSTHLSEDEIDRFLAGRLEPAGRERMLRHLTAGCGACSRRLVEQAPGRLLDEAAESRRGRASRDPLRDRAIAAALEQDARWRPDEKKLDRSLELLRAHPQGYDGLTFRQVRALHGRPLVEALLQRSWEVRFLDHRMMRWLAYNAVQAAESLRPEDHQAPAELFDLQARAWGELANAYKTNDAYAEAEAAFGRARALLRRGTGDPHLLALMAWRESSLRSAQRRLTEARDLLDRAYRLFLRLGSRSLAGQVLISKGLSAEYDHTYRQGLPLFRQGLALLDPERDSQLLAVGHHGLIGLLMGCGEYRQAGRLLLESDLRQWIPGPRVRWAEGRLLAALGQTTKAEHALTAAQDDFLEDGRPIAAALLALDLLPVLARQGKLGPLRKTARTTYDILRDQGLPGEAAMAGRYLRWAQ
jgi:tetratricopeptide (TPR) repeat protein